MKTIANILAGIIAMPIWWYLVYKMLQGINASELTWFLFWVYIPVSLLARILYAIVERQERQALKGS